MSSVSLSNFSVNGFQKLNKKIYGKVNRRHYSKPQMVSRMHRYVTRVLKAARRGNHTNIPYCLSMAFSWTCALANELDINLELETWRRFPGICSHCMCGPCACGEADPPRSPQAVRDTSPQNLRDFQAMFAQIYPKNILKDEAIHLAEELGEVDEAVEHFMGTNAAEMFGDIVPELADTFAHICGVANCVDITLAFEMESNFPDGCCHGCRKPECICGYVIAKAPGSFSAQ